MIEKVWQKYFSILNRLQRLVDNQTEVLRNQNWQQLTILIGEKENAFRSLQLAWEELAHLRKSNMKNVVLYRSQAEELIKAIQQVESKNKELLTQLLVEKRLQLNQVRTSKNHNKTYLESMRCNPIANLDLVS